MLDSTLTTRTQQVLDALNAALEAGDVDAVKNLFATDSYWRDLVSVTWNLKTVEGPDGVAAMLSEQLDHTRPGNFQIQAGEMPTEENGVVTTWITFETKVGRGWGLMRLKDDRIWTLLTALQELKGFEENRGKRRPMGTEHGAKKNRATWKESREAEEARLGYDIQPYTVIVGGGQGGIALGARLRQLGVPTIVLDKHERPGDQWRSRYKSLCLHDPIWYDHLPYIKFPDNWPVFTPKDKVGDWLEMYTKVMEINYWTRSEVQSAQYDEASGTWTVQVNRDGEQVTLRPTQLVLATGMSGKPNMPNSPAWTASRARSSTRRSTRARTRGPERRSSSSAPTTLPMTSAPRYGRRMPT